jgi:SOS response regulatory protein OraA/RecX
LLEQHHSKAEIIELLKADYPAPEEYPEHAVKYLFENCMHEFLPSNVEEQLKKYINHYYAKGMSKAALKKVLVDAGWSKKIIDKMLKMEEEEE